jgi:hypothetical protein
MGNTQSTLEQQHHHSTASYTVMIVPQAKVKLMLVAQSKIAVLVRYSSAAVPLTC